MTEGFRKKAVAVLGGALLLGSGAAAFLVQRSNPAPPVHVLARVNNADTLFYIELYDSVVEAGVPLTAWSFPPAPCWFPDLTIVFAARAAGLSPDACLMLYWIFVVSCAAFAARLLALQLFENAPPGWFALAGAFWFVIAASTDNSMSVFVRTLLPGHHGGAAASGLLFQACALLWQKTGARRYLVFGSLLGVLTLMGDLYFLITGILPVGLWALFYKTRRGPLLASVALVCVLGPGFSELARQWLSIAAAPGLDPVVAATRLLDPGAYREFYYYALPVFGRADRLLTLVFFGIVFYALVWRRGRVSGERALATVSVLVVVANLVSIFALGYWTQRYLSGAALMAWACVSILVPICFAKLTSRPAMTIALSFVFLVLVFQLALRKETLALNTPAPYIDCLQKELGPGIPVGYADYWRAREVRMYSDLVVLDLSRPQWMTAALPPHDPKLPTFVVTDGLEAETVAAIGTPIRTFTCEHETILVLAPGTRVNLPR